MSTFYHLAKLGFALIVVFVAVFVASVTGGGV